MSHILFQRVACLAAALFVFIALPFAYAQDITEPFCVYFTFEDGPTHAYTPEILTEYDAKATFFVNGWQIKGKGDRTGAAGHPERIAGSRRDFPCPAASR
ncbi:MAG: polysaccharide deacetylase family protein [Chloroflexi bacterium]|nr:polysaccharide deacetylase family protein [Chloroflexota bacterium]